MKFMCTEFNEKMDKEIENLEKIFDWMEIK